MFGLENWCALNHLKCCNCSADYFPPIYPSVRELAMSAEKNQPNCEVFSALALTVVEELKIPVQNQEFIMH